MRVSFTSFAAAALVALALTASASAAPFITVSLEASPTGAGTFSNTLAVTAGETYDYRVRFTMAPVGTSNTNPSGTANDTINSYSASPVNGLNNMKISLFQALGDAIQVDFAEPTLDGNFDEPPGANDGTPTDRGNGNDNIVGIQATAAAGSFFGVPTANTPAPTLLLSGTFTVTQGGAAGVAQVGIQGVSGTFLGMKYNGNPGATYNGTTTHQNGGQPPVAFENLTLTPEPATLGFLGLAGVGLIRRRRVA